MSYTGIVEHIESEINERRAKKDRLEEKLRALQNKEEIENILRDMAPSDEIRDQIHGEIDEDLEEVLQDIEDNIPDKFEDLTNQEDSERLEERIKEIEEDIEKLEAERDMYTN